MTRKKPVNIDNINIHIASGWNGDPVFLARKIAAQIQQQAQDLHSSNQLNISCRGHFAGNSQRVSSQLSEQLIRQSPRSASRRFK